jgi:DNA-binding transcriptional regulator YiaG
MNLACTAPRPSAEIAYPNFTRSSTSAFSKPAPRIIKLGPYEALVERTGTGRTEGSNRWLLSGFSETSSRSLLAEAPAALPAAGNSANTIVAAPQSAGDQVRFIQAALGLTVSHLAAVLNVERQTIYNWLQAEEPPALQSRTRTRLAEVVEWSRKWNQRCPRPAGKLAASLDLGQGTLLDLLKQTPINEAALRSAMDALAESIEGARARRHKRIQGLEPPPETSDDRILRRATGIPLNKAPNED